MDGTLKVIAILYALIWGSLLVLCVIVTFTTNVGFWGVLGIVGCAWMTWRQLAVLRDASG